MMAFRKVLSLGIAPFCAALLVSGCGDSTGPGNLDASAALQSLALGLADVGEAPTTPIEPTFGGIAPLLDQIEVQINGKSQTMFALALRESFPDGTCEEDIFVVSPTPPGPAICTPPPSGVALILWQSHSATRRPDRLIVLVGEAGTTDFDFDAIFSPTSTALPGFGTYIAGQNDVWLSLSGTLTSSVAASSQSCSLPLPPYAKAATCSIATFDEQGTIVFEQLSEVIPNTARLTLTIPRGTVHGLWQSITEIKPIPFTAFSRAGHLPAL
jgi:hypothetical protein